MRRKLKVVFVGGRDRGYECIKMLYKKGQSILHIFCMQEDDHERIKFYPEIVEFAKIKKIPLTLTKSIKRASAYSIIKKVNPDIIIVMGWRTMIPEKIRLIPQYGMVGAHESLLPQYRGFAPINWTVINGEKETGVTLFHLEKGVDSGDIIDQQIIKIGPRDTAWDIYKKTKELSVRMLENYLADFDNKNKRRKKQKHNNATYTVARTPDDGLISWDWSSKKIYNLIRGLSSPYPGAFTFYNHQKIIIQKASLLSNPPNFIGRIPGRIASIGNGYVDVITGDSTIRIEEIESSDGKRIKASSLIISIKGTLKEN